MMLRARHVVLAWLACGALQLALLGVGGVGGGQAGIAERGTRTQAAWPSVSFANRLLAPDPTDRRATLTPFAPASYVRFDVPTIVGPEAVHHPSRPTVSLDAVALPPARAPPALD